MLVSTLFTLLAAGAATAVPLARRDVSLDAAATAEAQKFDATATRALTATTITTSDGKCLSVNPFSGDFRENLTPVNVVACDGSKNQTWDVITAGVHNNVKGQALIVSSLTNACLNFDPRRAAGNQVLLFSCGGRADGGGQVTDSQLFAFNGATGAQALTPQNGKNAVCLTVKGSVIDQVACNGAASATGAELFTFGGKAAPAASTKVAATTKATNTKATSAAAATTAAVTECASVSVSVSTATSTTAAAATTPIKVSGAGGTLDPTAVAEAQKKDLTATRAATGVQIKSSDGQCLSVDATSGDFRENLTPITVQTCDGSDGQKFDFITKGVHNDQDGKTLIVSSLTNACLNFDDRRAAGDQVIMFSCGGRADGSGQVNNSQLFPFVAADLTAPYALTPTNANGVCFVNTNGRLTNVACDTTNPAANELFTIVA
ncbi:hypothetical protein DFH08DRAFT_917095 [Mycena albidolilacea]|uniref:Ricin B lectin domain-containing protein n=1 Tax=Mycena albidolilacea TaxID=1033008 RepID=A0AAD6ZHH2_9AGAR|nr:hypothetical protein DFH08DRAFT_917095 [Mycena albidolilacea]